MENFSSEFPKVDNEWGIFREEVVLEMGIKNRDATLPVLPFRRFGCFHRASDDETINSPDR